MEWKIPTIVGIAMLMLGGGIVIYRGYSITREETILNIGPLDMKATAKQHAPIPAMLGWVLVVGGAFVLAGEAVFKPS